MIYPANFPSERDHEHAEKAVFERLKSLSDTHDIFYSKRFLNARLGRKSEFEVDFIIAKPNRYVIILEVKGGLIKFNGSQWTQNGNNISKAPDEQASSNCHGLVNKYSNLSRNVPFIWMLCFPDCEMPNESTLPPSLTPYHILDRGGLYDVAKTLRLCIEKIIGDQKSNTRPYVYDNFKTDLLREIGFVRTLGTSIKYQEEQFVDLTAIQLKLIESVSENRKMIIHGSAGTGKTIIAKHMAMQLFEEGESVLLMCYNRLLANKIRDTLNIRRVEQEKFQVTTFHSIAREIITETEPEWWELNSKKDEFWTLDVPSKMDEILESQEITKYDTIIIDEGQDFKEFWFDVIFKLGKPDGRRYIFLDSMQNIFGHYSEVPNKESYFRFKLTDNLRNTKSIVNYINQKTDSLVRASEKSPSGENVVEIECKNNVEIVKKLKDLIEDLVTKQNIDTSQILILLEGNKADSPIADVKKIQNFQLKSLDRKARFEKNVIHYSNIKTFKGLEVDILFIFDSLPSLNNNYQQMFYTLASRAKHGLYVFKIVD